MALGIRSGNKCIMLFCRHTSQRLKPVGIVSRPPLNCPFLHSMSHYIRNGRIQLDAPLNGFFQLPVHALGEALPHSRIVKHIFSKNLRHVDHIAHFFLPFSKAEPGCK